MTIVVKGKDMLRSLLKIQLLDDLSLARMNVLSYERYNTAATSARVQKEN